MRIGFTYDLKEDYVALGFAEHEVAEFDSPTTIEAIAGALTRARPRGRAHRSRARTCRAARRRLAVRPRLQHRRRRRRIRARVAGSGLARGLRNPVHLFRPARLRVDVAQGNGEARRARLRRADAGLRARDEPGRGRRGRSTVAAVCQARRRGQQQGHHEQVARNDPKRRSSRPAPSCSSGTGSPSSSRST